MGKKVYQTLILVPFLISIVVVSYLVYGFLSTDAGFINNSILKPMGKEGNWMVFQCEILAIHFDFCQYMEKPGI